MNDQAEVNGNVSATTLRRTLKYLYAEAMQAGLYEPAHFIAVASGSCRDIESGKREEKPATSTRTALAAE